MTVTAASVKTVAGEVFTRPACTGAGGRIEKYRGRTMKYSGIQQRNATKKICQNSLLTICFSQQ